MAVKWLPPSRCSFAKAVRVLITSSPVAKMSAYVFWPPSSCSNCAFTVLPPLVEPPPQQPAGQRHAADQGRLHPPRTPLLGRLRGRRGVAGLRVVPGRARLAL